MVFACSCSVLEVRNLAPDRIHKALELFDLPLLYLQRVGISTAHGTVVAAAAFWNSKLSFPMVAVVAVAIARLTS